MHRFTCLATTLLIFSIPSIAAAQAAQDVCNGNERIAMYTDYYNKKKGDAAAQKEAYDIAKQYLQKWPQCSDQYAKAVQKFIDAYDQAKAQTDLQVMVFGTNPNYPQAMELGKRLLVSQPDDLNLLMTLGYAGYLALLKNNNALSADATIYSRKALQLIESGKTPAVWSPFQSKKEALALLNYALGEFTFSVNKDAAAAFPLYLKAATIDSPTKKSAVVYGRLATTYEVEYERLNQDYITKFGGKPETDESKAALEKVNQLVDRLIDYYARAISFAGNDAKLTQNKSAWMERLTEIYKFRHGGMTDGLDQLVANVTNTPLPQP